MKIEDAITKAIEGGYKQSDPLLSHADKKIREGALLINKHIIILDPSFWQCLGKAMGWSEWKYCLTDKPTKDMMYGECEDMEDKTHKHQEGWIFYWHSLIDHLASGKDIESFFNSM